MDDPSFLPREDAYEALYSKDKRRKKKRWTDGIAKVKISKENLDKKTKKVIIYDENGKRQITHSFVELNPPEYRIENDLEFETEKYIIQILNIMQSDKTNTSQHQQQQQYENYNNNNQNVQQNRFQRNKTSSVVGLRKTSNNSLSIRNKSLTNKVSAGSFKNAYTQQYRQPSVITSSWRSAGIVYTRDEVRLMLEKAYSKNNNDDTGLMMNIINNDSPMMKTNMNYNNEKITTTTTHLHENNINDNERERLNTRRSIIVRSNNNDDNNSNSSSSNSNTNTMYNRKVIYNNISKKNINNDVNSYRNFLSNFSFMKVLTTASKRANWRNENKSLETLVVSNTIKQTPTSFSSIEEYLFTMEELTHQEIIIGLQDASKHFWEATKRLQNIGDEENPFCECTKPKKVRSVVKIVKKEGRNKGKMFYTCSKSKKKGCGFFKWCNSSSSNSSSNTQQRKNNSNNYGKKNSNNNKKFNSPLQNEMNEITQITRLLSSKLKEDPYKLSTTLRASGISFYANCTLVRRRPSEKMKINNENIKSSYYFKCSNPSLCENTNRTKQGDLWILTRSMNFSSCCIMRATFHGFTNQNVMQLAALPECKPFYVGMNEEVTVHAVRAFNCTSEFEMLDNINNLMKNQNKIPILKSLSMVGENDSRGNTSEDNSDEFNLSYTCKELKLLATEIKDKFTLNEDQNKVLQTIVSKWFKPVDYDMNNVENDHSSLTSSSSCDNIILVHGCFGTGKSYMMVALIHFIIKVIEMEETISKKNCDIRLLIACSTNVAVDRVLKTLLETGYTDFDRVGVNQNVEKSLRKYVQKSSTSHIVVGSTLASCTSQAMQGETFQIVFLDECSQQIEPSSLMAMGFGCKRALLVGDPLQLPPVCKYSTIVDSNHTNNNNNNNGSGSLNKNSSFNYIAGMDRALFLRLQESAKMKKIMLRIQYRLHPVLSQIPNELFYENMLKNGVTHEDRKPLVPLKALVAYDCRKGYDQRDRVSNSYSNDYEAKVIVKLLRHLINDGVSEEDIGIICLYKAQAEKIKGMLGQKDGNSYANNRNNRNDFIINSTTIGKKKISKKEQAKAERRMKTLIKVSTVDAFQGAEREIIILSTVRSTVPKTKDKESFISSKTRMCVALSRGKRHLFVVGDLHMLKRTNIWTTVIQRIDQHGTIFSTEQVDRFLNSPIPPQKEKEKIEDTLEDTNGVNKKRKNGSSIHGSNDSREESRKKKKKKRKKVNSLIDDEAEEADSDEEEILAEDEINSTFIVDDDDDDDDNDDDDDEIMSIKQLK